MKKHKANGGETGRDRPVEHSDFGESYDSVIGDYRKSLKRIEDTLVLKGLSIAEAYIEGRARIAVEFRAHSWSQADGCGSLLAAWHFQNNTSKPTGVFAVAIEQIDSFDNHAGTGGDQAMVLVGNVEPMDAVNFGPAHLERLYFVEDESDSLGVREGTCFLSVNGRFRVLPRVAKRELCPSIDAALIGLDQCTVSVVKGTAEVVDGITNDGWRVPGNVAAQSSLFPTLRIGLGAKGFNVFHHVGPNNHFKLLDVMIGPFYF